MQVVHIDKNIAWHISKKIERTIDTFMCSTNALTESGELYNIDGNGSRAAPIMYGPRQVILVLGINKIVRDLDEAEKRVRQYVAPLDAIRLGKETPCTALGYCTDCASPNRICNDFVVIKGQFVKGRIKVIIIKSIWVISKKDKGKA